MDSIHTTVTDANERRDDLDGLEASLRAIRESRPPGVKEAVETYSRFNYRTGEWLHTGVNPTEYMAAQYDGQGKKDAIGDPSKLPLDLVPRSYIEAAARALDHGARKYSRHNWRRGIAYSEVYAALLRHLTAWNDGQDLDEDSGLNHLDHAAACLAFLTEYVSDPGYARCDDRYKGGAV